MAFAWRTVFDRLPVGAGRFFLRTETPRKRNFFIMRDVLILGAGLCGLQAAGDLHKAKRRVLVLDKSRGVGGRAATRRWDGVPVDHGAQFFTVRTWAFWAQAARWLAHGVCFPWAEGFHQWDPDKGLRAPDPEETGHPRYACAEGMSALGKSLSHALPPDRIRLGAKVTALRLVDDEWGRYWRAEIDGASPDEEAITARAVILTLPVPQALALLESSGLLDKLDADALGELRPVEVAPTLAVILRGPAPRPGWKGIQLRDDTLSWIGADSDKRPGDADAAQVFVLHGSAEFSRRWQDGDLEEAARLMTARAGEIVGDWITRLPDRQIHRWRYASVPHGLKDWAGVRLSKAGSPALLLAGDAFLGAKIEGAFLSGQEVAKVVLSEKKHDPAKPKPFVWPPPPPPRGSQPGLYPPAQPLEMRG